MRLKTATANLQLFKLACSFVLIALVSSKTFAGGGGGGGGNSNNGAQDCSTALSVCTDASFSGNSSGAGTNTTELSGTNQGCLSTEHQSSWYRFTAATSGVIELTISTTVDYDFAIWSGTTCPPTSAPVRCSFAAGGGNTGLMVKSGAAETTEGAGGDRFIDELVVTAGQTYTMLIDNFVGDGTDFTLDWTLSGGATMTCLPLPIVIIDFSIENNGLENIIMWESVAELDYEHTIVQRSRDGVNFTDLETHKSIGTNGGKYSCLDKNPFLHTYYRLKQVSKNGDELYSEGKKIKLNSTSFSNTLIRPNPVNNNAFIDLFLEKDALVTTVITDVRGNVSLSEKNMLSAGNNNIDLDLVHLKKGMYFIKIISDTGEIIAYSKFSKE